MGGFFPGGNGNRKPVNLNLLLPACGACGLHKTCKSPKMKPTGKGRKNILIIGEFPGEKEDDDSRQFVGKTGNLFRTTMYRLGVDVDSDCVLTNALICHPPNNVVKDDKAVDYCRPNLINTIQEMEPDIIIPLGSKAVEALVGWVWKENWGQMFQWVGWQIPCQKPNAWVCPTWHPKYVEQEGKNPAVKLLWEQHLKKAISLSGKPWRKPPDYESECKTTFDADEAFNVVRRMRRANKPVAFDFETDRLKPDHKDAFISCCSVSDGKTTLAFPWVGRVVPEMKKLLMSDIPKIGYNIKFEDRWVRRICGGRPARNWLWDGQIACHILDNRDRITSLKFQSFVQLGAPEYDWKVKPYLSSTGGNDNSPNRIKELDMQVLLTYNSIDSYLEYKIAFQQRKELGYVD